ncbi:hypothetical protein ACFC6L_34145 [Kitasatospora phosalacinea]|uniref:VMAP-C domain-containing protein n=1 Tax=Kitasatospora phosalacinea TaxID=2065 RepID=UPI0035D5EDDB
MTDPGGPAADPDEVDPEKVHALVVAVEDYGAYSSDWNVDGPYAGARAFRDWLLGRGVPAANITFLALPLPRNREEGPVDPPDGDALTRFLGEVLPEADAELLWVFWAGHGITDRDQRHQLFLPAPRRKGLETVDVRELRDTLISAEYGTRNGARPLRVAMVVDACQNNLPPAERELPTWPIPVRSRNMRSTDRPFFAVYACGPGQKAYTGASRTHLATALMAHLGADAPLLPRPRHLMAAVDLAFARLAEASAQTPSWEILSWGSPTGTGFFELIPTEEEHALALRLWPHPADPAELRRCVAELGARGVPVPTHHPGGPPGPAHLVAAAGRVRHGLPTLIDLLHPNGWDGTQDDPGPIHRDEFLTVAEHDALLTLLDRAGDALERVARFGRSWSEHLHGSPVTARAVARRLEAAGVIGGRLPLLLGFTALLAALTEPAPGEASAETPGQASAEAPGGAAASVDGPLQDWWTAVATRLGHRDPLLREERQRAAADAAKLRRAPGGWLLVEVRTTRPEAAPGDPNDYDSRAWYFDARGTHQQVFHGTGWTKDWQRSLGDAVAGHLDQELGGIEFMLPRGHLELQVERLVVEHQGRANVLLGHVHPVVVRCADRDPAPERQAAWRQRWTYCTLARDGAPWLVRDGAAPAELADALTRHRGCVELTGTARDFREALAACLREGSPVIAWNRCTGDARPLRSLQKIHVHAPADLPAALHDWRRQGPSSGSDDVVLLWDNPDRRARRPKLRSPGRRTA